MKLMSLDNWTAEIRSDLYDAGLTEDGEHFYAEVYYVVITHTTGRQMAHEASFNGTAHVEHEDPLTGQRWEGFEDLRDAAKASCQRILDAMARLGRINAERWTDISPAYGSDAYINGGGDSAFLPSDLEEHWEVNR